MNTTPRFLFKLFLIVLLLGVAVWRIIPGSQQPKVPVEVSFQKAGMHIGVSAVNGIYAEGMVRQTIYPQDKFSVVAVRFENRATKPMAIDIKVSSPVSQKSRSSQMVLQPNTWQELGRTQGWEFAAEDEITINSAGYRQRRVNISP